MKKTLIMLAALALFAVGTANAAVGDKWFGISGGMSVPTGDAGDALKSGFNGTLFGAIGVAKQCDVGIDLGYHMFKGKDDFGGDDFSFNALQATAFTSYVFPVANAKARPYVKIGVGLYNATAKLDVPAPFGFDESESDLGFNGGGGFDYEVSPNYTLGLAAAYHQIQTEGDATNMFTVGVKLAWGTSKQ